VSGSGVGRTLTNTGLVGVSNTTLTRTGSNGTYTVGLNLGSSNTWTAGQTFTGGFNSNATSNITNLIIDGTSGIGISISNNGINMDIGLQNGETIDNNTDGNINFSTSSLSLGGTTFLTNGRLFQAGNGNVTTPAYSFSADTNTGMYRGGTSILRFTTAGNDRLTIAADGSVGIGTTNPGSKLTILGDASNDIVASFKTTGAGVGDYAEMNIANNNDDKIVMGSIGSNYTNTDWAGATYLYNTGTGRDMYIKSQDRIDLFTGGTALSNIKMSILSGGNVGIGTTNPNEKLEINGDLFVTGNDIYGSGNGLTLTRRGTTSMGFGQDFAGSAFEQSFWGAGVRISNSASDPRAENNIPAGNLIVDGNVGIGTTNPSQKLDVNGSIKSQQIVLDNITGSNYNEGLRIDGNPGTWRGIFLGGETGTVTGTNANMWSILRDNTNNFRITNNASNNVLIYANASSVGIGTTNPSAKLTVAGNGSFSTNLSVGGTVTLSSSVVSNTSDTTALMINGSNIVTKRVLGNLAFMDNTSLGWVAKTASGNLNIGTGTTLNFTGINGLTTANVGTSQITFGLGGALTSNTTLTGAFNLNLSQGSLSVGTTIKTTNLFANGNVGIGTSSPGTLLTIANNGDNSILRLENTGIADAATQTIGSIEFYRDETDIGASVRAKIVGYSQDTADRDSELQFYTKSIAGSLTQQMVINNTGNVGIGTTNPTSKLHVIGNGNITASLNVGTTLTTNTLKATRSQDTTVVTNLNADLLDGLHLSGIMPANSDRDFADGTIITTNINYGVTNGDPWVLEIKGNSYGSGVPFDIQYQGYIYSDTIINHGGYSNGTNITGLVALNVGGSLTFWFPRQAYWQGFNVNVYSAYGGIQKNQVLSITNGIKPTGTKEVALSANIVQSWHTGNDGSGSGLDADLLDGYQGSAYGRLAVANTWTQLQTFSAGATASALSVNGNLSVGGTLSLTGTNVGTGTTALFIASNGTITKRVLGDLAFQNNYTLGWVAKTASGNLNIGTGTTLNFTGINGLTTANVGTSQITFGLGGALTSNTTLTGAFNLNLSQGSLSVGTTIKTGNLFANGSVGIGTTAPGSLLELYGATPLIGLNSNTDASVDFGIQANGENFEILEPEDSSKVHFRIADDQSVQLRPNGVDVLWALASGNVGIGTTNPTYKLHVIGNGNISTSLNVGTSLVVGTDLTVNGGDINLNNNNGGINYNDASAYWLKTATNWGLYWDTTNNQFAFNGSGATKSWIDLDDGKAAFLGLSVGSTIAPTATLTVSGNGSFTTNLTVGYTITTNDLSLGATIPVADNNIVLTQTAAGGLVQAINTSAWDKNASDDYAYWTLKTNSVGSTNILTGSTVNFVNGVGISLAQSGSTVTIHNIAGLYTAGNGLTLAGTQFKLGGLLSQNTDIGFSGFSLTFSDGGNTLVSFSSAGNTFYNPTTFTSSGDVSMAYDLNFTNSTASYIRSQAPLYIQTESPYANLDLNLTAANAGQIYLNSNVQAMANLTVGGTFVSVGSTNLVTNLNADLLDGYNSTQFGRLATANTWTALQTFSAGATVTNITITGNGSIGGTLTTITLKATNAKDTTKVTNLNADLLDNIDSTGFILNQFASAQSSSNFWISGNGLVGGKFGVGATSTAAFNVSTNGSFGTNLTVGSTLTTNDLSLGATIPVADNNIVLTQAAAGGLVQAINTSAWDKNASDDLTTSTNLFVIKANGGTAETVNVGNTINFVGGAGLGSTVSATDTITFNIGSSAGITVNADNIGINAGYGLTFSGTQLILNMGSSNVWTAGQTFNGGFNSNATSNITNLIIDGTSGVGISISSNSITADIGLQNGKTIDNDTAANINFSSSNLALGGTIFLTDARLFQAGNGNVTTPAYSFSGDTNTGIYRIGEDNIGIGTSGILRFIIAGNGNVGIGTTAPGAKLNVDGNLYISGTTGINQHSGSYSVGSGIRELFRVPAASLMTGGMFTISATRGSFVHTSQWAWSSSHNSTGTGMLTQLSSNSYSNIMVYLDVDSSGNMIVSADWGAAQAYSISIQKMSGGAIDLSNYGTDWTTVNAGYTRVRAINSITYGFQTVNGIFSGNVGIGTTNPNYKLDVIGDGRFTSNLTIGGSLSVTNLATFTGGFDSNALSTVAGLNIDGGGALQVGGTTVISSTKLFTAADGTAASPAYGFSADSGVGMYRLSADNLAFSTADTMRLQIAANGKVGIGATNNSYLFNVNGDISTNASNSVFSSKFFDIGNTNFFLDPNNTSSTSSSLSLTYTGSIGFNYSDSSHNFMNAGAASRIQNFTNGLALNVGSSSTSITWNDNLFLSTSGNVGIGTTAPTSKLHVIGDITTTTQFNGSGAGLTGTASSLTAGAVLGLTLTSSVNGINPDNVIQNQLGYNNSVSLFGQTDGGLYSSAYSSSWIHQIFGDFRTGQIAIRGKNSGTWQAWRTVLDSANNVSSSGNLMITGAGPHYIQSGNVGIGTTNPGQKLDVSGNINLNTNGTSALFSTYKGANSNGYNLFLGGGGQSSIGNVTYTYQGSYNTAIGLNSLSLNTTGYSNVASGYSSLAANTTGYQNVANGSSSLYSNTIGQANTATGHQSLYLNTTGNYNTASGYWSLYANRTGSYNTALGYYALGAGTTLNANIAVGYRAGLNLSIGSSNIFLGNDNGATGAYDNRLYIGNGQNPIIYGNLANNNISIGTTATGARLTVLGNSNSVTSDFTLLNGDGTANLEIRTGLTDLNNIFIGTGVGQTNTTGSANTANGSESLRNNTTGSYNTANGYYSLNQNISGSFNTSFGMYSLEDNTTGSYNTALGNQSIYNNKTGNYNTAVGINSLGLGTTLNSNIGLGMMAGYNLSIGSSNIFLGNNNGATGAYDNRLYIGNGQNPVIYGDLALGNIGIGTTNPRFKAEINNALYVSALNVGITVASESFSGTSFAPTNYTTGVGDSAFVRDVANYQDTAGSATNGAVPAWGFAWIETTVNMPSYGYVNYWWKVSSEASYDFLVVCVDRSTCNLTNYDRRISGTVDWTQVNIALAAGSHTIRWGYAKDGYTVGGTDQGWIDNITFGLSSGNIYTDGNISIGTTTANARLTILGDSNPHTSDLTLLNADGTPGIEIRTDLTWNLRNTFIGYNVGASNTSGDNNTALGAYSFINNTSGFANTSVGRFSLYANISGFGNNAFGSAALSNNTTGYDNIAFGNNTLSDNLSGHDNIAIGSVSMWNNITGNKNVALGSESLYYNNSDENVAIGYYSLNENIGGTGNSALGSQSLKNNTSGNYNTASGYKSLYFSNNGSNNTALGSFAGYNIGNGSSNVFLGYEAGYNETGSNKLYIANSQNNTLIYGSFSTGNVSIGTTVNTARLTIKGDSDVNNPDFILLNADNSTNLQIRTGLTDLNNIYIGKGSGWTNTTGSYNTSNGSFALSGNTTGSNNTANGSFALASNTTGYQNTANGSSALVNNISGNINVAMGYQSLYTNTIGGGNVAIGSNSLTQNINGNWNTAVGEAALTSNTSGVYNTAYGQGSLGQNSTGSYNTVIGSLAGYSVGIGSSNVFLGYQAGYNETGSNKLYIANSQNNALVYGDFSSGNISIGTTINTARLTIKGDSDSATSDFTLLNGDGTTSLEIRTGIGDSANTFIGINVGSSNTTGYRNTGLGYGSLRLNTTGYRNTAIGYGSLRSNTEGFDNLAFGNNSLFYNTTGSSNAAFGGVSLFNNTTGNYNSAVGGGSLSSNTEGFNNSAFGYNSLFWNTTGYRNSTFGSNSLSSNTTGNNNTSLGYFALGFGTTLNSNIAIGYEAGMNLSVGSSNIFLGNSNGAGGAYSNRLYIGNGQSPIIYGDLSTGYVGIGTTAPGTPFAVAGLTGTTSGNYLRYYNNNFYYYSSSARYKDNIEVFDDDFSKILNIEPKIFTDKTSGERNIGFIAEEMDAAGLNHLVTYKNGLPDTVEYQLVSAYLLQLAKQQKIKIDNINNDLSLTQTGQISVNTNVSDEVLSSLGYDGAKNEIEAATYSLTDTLGNTVSRISQFSEIASAKIKTGLLSATNIITKNMVAEKIVSPSADIGSLKAATATVSGTLSANKIETNDLAANTATVSTLYADNIISKEGSIGELMTAKVSALRDELKNLVALNTQSSGASAEETTLTGTSLQSQSSTWSMNIASDSAKITGDLELGNNLIVGAKLTVNGDTQLGNAFITGTFTAGEIAIKDNFIETTNTALYIQPSQTGSVHIMGDTLVIAENGNIQINGNLTVSGSLMANLIVADEIQANKLTAAQINSNEIKIATDSAQTIVAESGFGQIATSSAKLTSNATAGTATLPSGKTEIVITNDKITANSMVYLTPVGSTNNQVPYIKTKMVYSEAELLADPTLQNYFTISLDNYLDKDIQINWWIIN
ncbi:MAG: tail fiber domain-containing protein, partial [Candidatus Shapirobacteria bacterium]